MVMISVVLSCLDRGRRIWCRQCLSVSRFNSRFVIAFIVTCVGLVLALIVIARIYARWRLLSASGDRKLMSFYSTANWGVGNHMFAFASTLSIALSASDSDTGLGKVSGEHRKSSPWRVCIGRSSPLREAFDQLREWPSCEPDDLLDLLGAKKYREIAYGRYDSQLLKDVYSSADYHVVLDRFLQSWRYFAGYDSTVRRLFEFSDAIKRRAHAALADVIEQHLACVGCYDSGDVITVGVHVRLGDMNNDERLRRQGYKTADVGYLTKAMEYFDGKLKTANQSHHHVVVFVVSSDDIEWCRDELSTQNGINRHVVFISTRDPLVDMAVLAQCRHSIISVGTFGWWSAWLANGITVYYKDWPLKHSLLDKATSHEDYFYPQWIPL